MASVLNVSPYDGGWCLKIADTGEVLFFSARRRAIAQAMALAASWPRPVKVQVKSRRSPSRETWARPPIENPYRLGIPA